ncbi:MAG: GNAT family N-acetyltransferase, partial [Candidatus Heimdallarchaeota archaeon]
MKPRFVLGKKEDIQLNNLDSFIELMQLYRQEQLPYPAPTFEFWMKVWETPNLEEEEEFWVIALDENDKAIGYGLASWSIKYDNLDKAILRIFVKKEERRKGLGTRIISLLIENTPEQIKVISMGTVTTTDDGLKYLKSLKLEKCYEEIFQYVDLGKIDTNKIRKITSEQREKATKLGYDNKFIEGLDFASQLDYP